MQLWTSTMSWLIDFYWVVMIWESTLIPSYFNIFDCPGCVYWLQSLNLHRNRSPINQSLITQSQWLKSPHLGEQLHKISWNQMTVWLNLNFGYLYTLVSVYQIQTKIYKTKASSLYFTTCFNYNKTKVTLIGQQYGISTPLMLFFWVTFDLCGYSMLLNSAPLVFAQFN